MTNLRNFPTTATFLGEQSEQIVWEFSRDKAKKILWTLYWSRTKVCVWLGYSKRKKKRVQAFAIPVECVHGTIHAERKRRDGEKNWRTIETNETGQQQKNTETRRVYEKIKKNSFSFFSSSSPSSFSTVIRGSLSLRAWVYFTSSPLRFLFLQRSKTLKTTTEKNFQNH